MKLPLARILAAMWLLLFAAGAQAELHVSPSGDDQNPGTAERPLRTLARARDLVRSAEGDATILLRGGTHVLSEPLVLTLQDSAKANATITYAAAAGEKVVISGGRAITGWRQEGELLVADLPASAGPWRFRELFIAGERRPRARQPNEGYFRVEQAGPDNRTSFSFRAGDLQPLAGPHEAEVVFLHDWSTSRVRIHDLDPESRVVRLADPIGPGSPHYQISHFEPHPRYFVENAKQYLDAPGEWFLDSQAGKLFYAPRAGETAENLQAVAPWLETLIEVRGDAQAGQAVRGLRFKDLAFSYCRWNIPEHGYAGGQAGFHEARDGKTTWPRRVPIPAALTFDLAEDCRLENCRFEHLGGSGVYFRQQCHNNHVTACTFHDIAANGVMIGETITRTGPDGSDLVCRGNVVSESLVERCGALFYGAVGVWVGIAAETTIAKNEIRHLPYTGVSAGWRWDTQPTGCRDNAVRDNHIHHVMQILSDGGGIYTLGRQPGTVLAGNRIHDVPLNLGRAESNGMFLDEGTSLIAVENNTIYQIEKSPIRFHKAEKVTLRGNRLITAPGVPPFRYNNADPDSMVMEGNEIVEAKASP